MLAPASPAPSVLRPRLGCPLCPDGPVVDALCPVALRAGVSSLDLHAGPQVSRVPHPVLCESRRSYPGCTDPPWPAPKAGQGSGPASSALFAAAKATQESPGDAALPAHCFWPFFFKCLHLPVPRDLCDVCGALYSVSDRFKLSEQQVCLCPRLAQHPQVCTPHTGTSATQPRPTGLTLRFGPLRLSSAHPLPSLALPSAHLQCPVGWVWTSAPVVECLVCSSWWLPVP